MYFLPHEMYIHILKFTSIKDVFNVVGTSTYLNTMLKNDISDIIYEMDSLFVPPINYYLEYQRGKSYDDHDENIKDEIFVLNSFDHIIYHQKFLQYDNYAEIIITLNSNMLYTVYSFCDEVGKYEGTPDYYGYDDDDLDVVVLHKKQQYNDLRNIDIDDNLIRNYFHNQSNQKIKDAVHNKLLNYPFIDYDQQQLYGAVFNDVKVELF